MHSKNLANVSHAIPAPNVPKKYEGSLWGRGHERSSPAQLKCSTSRHFSRLQRKPDGFGPWHLPYPIYWGLSTNRLNPFRMIVYDFDPHRGILLKILPSDQTPTVHVHVLISLFCLSTKTPRFGGVCVLVFSITCLWVFECINSVCLLGLLRLCNYVFCMRVSASARC